MPKQHGGEAGIRNWGFHNLLYQSNLWRGLFWGKDLVFASICRCFRLFASICPLAKRFYKSFLKLGV